MSPRNRSKMTRTHHLHMKEVIAWRSTASIVWSALLLPMLLSACLVVIRIDLLHPYVWFIGCINDFFSISMVLINFVIIFITICVAAFNPKFCTVSPNIPCNRLSILWQTINPYRLFHATCHSLAAAVIAACLIYLSEPNSDFLITECTEDNECIDEKHLFIMLHGIVLGFCYSLQYFWNSENYITFPVIQKAKFLRVKGHIKRCVINSAWKTLRIMKYFYVAYFVFGSWNSASLKTLWFLVDFSLFWSVLLSGTFIFTTWLLALHIFKVYNTEAFVFPVETTFAEDEHKCLTRVLDHSNVALVKYLGYLDLSILSEHSIKRRKQIFSLSDPGGHPHSWDSVCKDCLLLIRSMASNLDIYQDILQSDMWTQSGDTTQDLFRQNVTITSPGASFNNSYAHKAMSPQRFESPRPEPQTEVVKRLNFKGYTPDPRQESLNDSVKSPTFSSNSTLNRNGTDKMMSSGRSRTSFGDRIDKMLSYFRSPLPVAVRRQLFADAQLHIWALTGLSRLVAASYSEDDFGVVQRSLPDILSSMLELHTALDKYCKLPVPSTQMSKQTKSSSVQQGEQMKNALRETVKSAIYRIVTTFGPSLKYVKVSSDNERQLSQFMQGKV